MNRRTITLLIAVLTVTTLEGDEMRSVKFRDVLWAVARKAGYSPESGNFLTNQAIPVGEYISEWVDRLYSAEDWPEWTKVVKIAPGTDHIVPYRVLPSGPGGLATSYNIWRVINVYLIDPETTSVPISTRFTLQDDGIHCGYEHGTFVWIKYIEPSPQFTAEVWRAGDTYQRDDVVYSYTTGECYKSKINGNFGHDPGAVTYREIDTEVTTPYSGPISPIEPVPEILDQPLPAGFPDPVTSGYSAYIEILDFNQDPNGGSTVYSPAPTVAAGESLTAFMETVRASLDALAPADFTITKDVPNKKWTITASRYFNIYGSHSYWAKAPPIDYEQLLQEKITQNYIPGNAGADGTSQIVKVTVSTEDVIPGATYQLSVQDNLGETHTVEYTASVMPSIDNILAGLTDAVNNSSDTYFQNLIVIADMTNDQLIISSREPVGILTVASTDASPYWEVVPFPEALFNPVVRGTSADLLGEWGQSDKQTTEEGKVPAEQQSVTADFQTTPTAPLTTQQRPYSRYRY